jgi:hypothetical protein
MEGGFLPVTVIAFVADLPHQPISIPAINSCIFTSIPRKIQRIKDVELRCTDGFVKNVRPTHSRSSEFVPCPAP